MSYAKAREFLAVGFTPRHHAQGQALTLRNLDILLLLAMYPQRMQFRDVHAAMNEGASKTSKGAISRTTDTLAAAGFVCRHVDPKDKRIVHVEILPEGRALADSLASVFDRVQ